LKRLLQEKEKEIIQAVGSDLHKHEIEIVSAEIAPVLGEIEFMLNVNTLAS
jgi:hypothetical protein